MNSLQYNNSTSNLKVLCIGCHAEEHNHQHMKNLPGYKEFLTKYKTTE